VITSFRHCGLKRLFERGDRDQVAPQMLARIENILAVLNRASRPEELDLPGVRLQPLKGDRAGQCAVTVSANWRIVFRFAETNTADVDLVDYH
jgi:proteic killer suppression protein